MIKTCAHWLYLHTKTQHGAGKWMDTLVFTARYQQVTHPNTTNISPVASQRNLVKSVLYVIEGSFLGDLSGINHVSIFLNIAGSLFKGRIHPKIHFTYFSSDL